MTNAPHVARPLLALHGVHGRDGQGLDGRTLGRLHGISMQLGSELVVVEGASADGTAALCEVASGRRAPSRGTLLVLGRQPQRSARLRRRIGALLPVADLPPLAMSASNWLAAATGADCTRLLDRLAISSLASRSLASLSRPEQRALELAYCLSIAEPLLLVLHEPRATMCDTSELATLLSARAAQGCCVLVTTASARGFADVDRFFRLRRGELRVGAPPQRDGLWLQFASAEASRAFIAELSQHQELSSLRFDIVDDGAVVSLRSAELAELSRAVSKIVASRQLPLLQLQPLSASSEAAL